MVRKVRSTRVSRKSSRKSRKIKYRNRNKVGGSMPPPPELPEIDLYNVGKLQLIGILEKSGFNFSERPRSLSEVINLYKKELENIKLKKEKQLREKQKQIKIQKQI